MREKSTDASLYEWREGSGRPRFFRQLPEEENMPVFFRQPGTIEKEEHYPGGLSKRAYELMLRKGHTSESLEEAMKNGVEGWKRLFLLLEPTPRTEEKQKVREKSLSGSIGDMLNLLAQCTKGREADGLPEVETDGTDAERYKRTGKECSDPLTLYKREKLMNYVESAKLKDVSGLLNEE